MYNFVMKRRAREQKRKKIRGFAAKGAFMQFIKRDGTAVEFDRAKIYAAIDKANNAVASTARINETDIEAVTASVVKRCSRLRHTPRIEEVQDMVEEELMARGAFTLAKTYITYRYRHTLMRSIDNETRRTIATLGED